MTEQPNCFDGPLARRLGHHDPGRTKPRRVTYEEQQAMPDLQRPARASNFVAPAPARRYDLPAQASTSYIVEAEPSAHLASVTHTNATDRARGYLMVQIPLAAAFAVIVLAVCKALAGFPLLSFGAFLIFWGSFVLAWLAGWFVTLLLSAEGVAFYEARRKWNVVEREQNERWAHYSRQLEG